MNANTARENVIFTFSHSLDGKRILKQISEASSNGRVEINASPNAGSCKLSYQALSMLGYYIQIVPIPAQSRFDLIVSWGTNGTFLNSDSLELL